MTKSQILQLIAAIALLACVATADPFIPYPSAGTIAPVNTFTATNTGPVTAYFFAYDAGYSSTVAVEIGMSVNGYYLPNKTTAYGTSAVLGNATAGDVLTFVLRVRPSGNEGNSGGEFYLYSDPTRNSDGLNHVYATPFSVSQNIGTPQIPAGIYVGWEDLIGGGDKDYNDHQFVFTNVSGVPDGGMSLMLLGGALVGLETLRRRFRG